MTDDRSLERAARSWLEEGPTRAPDRPIDAALARVQTTSQERDLAIPWRLPTMFSNRLAVAAVAIVLVVAVGGFALSRLPEPGGVGPGPTPTVSSVPSPTPSPSSPPLTITASDVGTSLRAGAYRVDGFAAPFSVTLPAGWTATEFTDNSIGLATSSDGTINFYMAIMGKVYANPCHPERGLESAGSGVDALVAALSSMAGFVVSDVADATVGGANGKTFTITNDIDIAASNCAGDMLPIGTYDNNGEDVDIAMFSGETDQFWVLDAGGTRVFMAVTDIAIEATQVVRDSLSFGDESTN